MITIDFDTDNLENAIRQYTESLHTGNRQLQAEEEGLRQRPTLYGCYGCSSSCRGSCSNSCYGCDGGCKGSCYQGCYGSCLHGCYGSCNNTCKWSCDNACRGGCENSCRGTCDSSAKSYRASTPATHFGDFRDPAEESSRIQRATADGSIVRFQQMMFASAAAVRDYGRQVTATGMLSESDAQKILTEFERQDRESAFNRDNTGESGFSEHSSFAEYNPENL